MTALSKVTVIGDLTHADGRKGIAISIFLEGGYVMAFLGKEDALRLYHSLGDAIMAMSADTTDNHVT